ncbi:hypothetical protein [Altericista sp. CCNU0014]|uniref:hypothetical protein n=1 Tax=Altericista sp. CCNU0014 TaxID=3082949 RepID=UPI00384E962B
MRVYQFRQFRADKQRIAAIHYHSLLQGYSSTPSTLFVKILEDLYEKLTVVAAARRLEAL